MGPMGFNISGISRQRLNTLPSSLVRFGEAPAEGGSGDSFSNEASDSPSVPDKPVYRPISPKEIVKAQRAAKRAADKAERAERRKRKKFEHDIAHNKEADPRELAKLQKQKALRKAGRNAAVKPAAVSLTVATGSLVGFALTGVPFFLVPLGTSIWAGIQLSGQSYSKAKADMNANYDEYLDQSASHVAKKNQPQLDLKLDEGFFKKRINAIKGKIEDKAKKD